ncbi:MAG: ketosteroid isomerase [Rhodospirillaceae bacterium]|nr:ketosteroid isomerase [Rhodospirillaceae bacterium]|tara:strand:+ start:565 stop:885 length:321 start_codon:yes stop_codon:yes gene_type:complete
MEMPKVISAYFEADRRNDADALVALFSADAVVEDERACHQGVHEIRKWWVSAKEQTHHVNEPIETTAADDRIRVRAKVSGDFPNSPVVLEFFFTIKSNKIVALEIR